MKSKGIYIVISLCFALFLGISSSSLAVKKLTHIAKSGDTLWAICEKYYGDPYLWPELWEMNKFITNPHWLHPGDVIKLLEYQEVKALPAKKAQPATKIVRVEKQPLKKLMGVDVSSLTNTRALGLLMQEGIEPWGRIFDHETKKILLGEDDIAYVKMNKEDIKPGDIFTIYSVSEPIEHPLTGEIFGSIHSFKGVLEIEEAKKDYHVAKITDSFRAIYKDDLLIPYDPVSSCILPIPSPETLTAHIVASKDNLDLLGQYSVVYIDVGHNMGVRRGQLFEVIEERESISDQEKEEIVALPPIVLGKILILKATENTSNGVVFWVSKEFTNGVKIRPQTWSEDQQPRELGMLPTCPVE
ncbi:MAG: LysM peptidoglycan-binding domain-containing protein [Desulfatiglandales bacterium]